LPGVAFVALLHCQPDAIDLVAFQTLVGLLFSNGPGVIQQRPDRLFTHCGYAGGGNNFEGVAFLLEQFKDGGLTDPGSPAHGVDIDTMKIHCVNHPVFKDKPVNLDPREVFIGELMKKRGEHNVFLVFYKALVQKR
jgi:hypothetical protein